MVYFSAMLPDKTSVWIVYEARMDILAPHDLASRPRSLQVMVLIWVGRGLGCFIWTRSSAWSSEWKSETVSLLMAASQSCVIPRSSVWRVAPRVTVIIKYLFLLYPLISLIHLYLSSFVSYWNCHPKFMCRVEIITHISYLSSLW